MDNRLLLLSFVLMGVLPFVALLPISLEWQYILDLYFSRVHTFSFSISQSLREAVLAGASTVFSSAVTDPSFEATLAAETSQVNFARANFNRLQEPCWFMAVGYPAIW